MKIGMLLVLFSTLIAATSTAATTETVDWSALERMSLQEALDYPGRSSYLLVDPVGDYVLYARTRAVPGKLASVMTGGSSMAESRTEVPHEQFENDPEGEKKFIDESRREGLKDTAIYGRENPFVREGFKRMFQRVIVEERSRGIEPSPGVVHEWSPEFLARYQEGSQILVFSKVLVALASGWSATFLPTGHEKELIQFILSQPEDSLTLPELFRASYRIHSGDVYLTLLGIENVLSRSWRNPHRENLPVTKRLKSITNVHGVDRDRFGTWYHLFGIMLYGYASNSTRAWLVGEFESLGGEILSNGARTAQKAWVNREGGPIGADLRKLVESKAYLNVSSEASSLAEESYLSLSEDYRDRLPITADPAVRAWAIMRSSDGGGQNSSIQAIAIKYADGELRGCTVDLIFDDGEGFNSTTRKEVKRNVTLNPKKWVYLMNPFAGPSPAVRGFIHGCGGLKGEKTFEVTGF